MIQSYSLKTVPFRILRPTLKTLMGAVILVWGQVDTDQKLSVKIMKLQDKTNALENPTRNNMATHLAAWYGVGLELADVAEATKPELATLLRDVLKEAGWIRPAWDYMSERMAEWQKS